MFGGTGLEWTVGEQIFLQDYHSSALFLTSEPLLYDIRNKLIIIRCYFVNNNTGSSVINLFKVIIY
jgi:hypothetical protein